MGPILAFFFAILLPGQLAPFLAGPYDTWEECEEVRIGVDQYGVETDDCTMLPLPQEAVNPSVDTLAGLHSVQ